MTLSMKKTGTNWIFVLVLWVAFAAQLTVTDFYRSNWFNLGLSIVILGFSLIDMRRRIALLIFTLAMDLFLIARPILDITLKFSQYYTMHYNFESAQRANTMISVSLLAILSGSLIYETWLAEKERRWTSVFPKTSLLPSIQGLSLGIGFISFIAFFITIQEKLEFRQLNSYTALYASFQSALPFVVKGFAAICVTMVILILLSTKRTVRVYGTLLIYLGLNAYLMLTGVRADFTKTLLFALFVFLQRDLLVRARKKHLIGILGSAIILGGILGTVFYSVEKQRSQEPEKIGYAMPVQLIYDQSISYMTVNRGQELKSLPLFKSKHYTFGPFLDTFGKNKDLRPYTKEFVEQADSMAGDIAYVLYGEKAFAGYGLGSSYLMEVYSDFNYPGIVIYSLLLGILLGSLAQISWTNLVVDAIKLRILLEIFYIPRAPATQFIVNLFVPQFILPVGGALVFAYGLNWLSQRRRHH